MAAQRLLTLPQLARLADVQYRTLHTWVQRGVLEPSAQASDGTGTPNLFTVDDAVTTVIISDLRRGGVPFEVLKRAARTLSEHADALDDDALLMVNGKVEIANGAQNALDALRRDGLTMVYIAAHAPRRSHGCGAGAARATRARRSHVR
jgi:DNA-binding transcriptional MerR regulator